MGHVGVTRPTFGIVGPLISPERFNLKTSNLAQTWMAGSTNEKICKIRSNGVMWGSRAALLEFWDPPNISGTVTAKNFKFGTEMEGSEYEEKKSKFGQRSHVGVT